MRFRAVVQLNGKTATGIQVPETVVEELGSGKRPSVLVTINDYTYRSTIASMGGKYMIPVSADVRQHAGIAAGDEIDVDLALDTEAREVVVPSDFAEALNGDSAARARFDGLSYSQKRRHILSIEGAKTTQTRQRRILGAVVALREGRT